MRISKKKENCPFRTSSTRLPPPPPASSEHLLAATSFYKKNLEIPQSGSYYVSRPREDNVARAQCRFFVRFIFCHAVLFISVQSVRSVRSVQSVRCRLPPQCSIHTHRLFIAAGKVRYITFESHSDMLRNGLPATCAAAH